ncbi:MAG TPA: YciI family protein, partial [Longimicrobium sp.]|nr:YciI family protein [Longimicrobium sp.]
RELFEAMMRYTEERVNAGVMTAGEGLHPSRKGARVAFQDGTPRVIDGPFAETKELVAGFSIWNVASLDEAVEWARRWPTEDGGGNVVLELRPIYEAEDFGPEFTDGILAQEDRLRAQAAANA